jgi:hypothetical protein
LGTRSYEYDCASFIDHKGNLNYKIPFFDKNKNRISGNHLNLKGASYQYAEGDYRAIKEGQKPLFIGSCTITNKFVLIFQSTIPPFRWES